MIDFIKKYRNLITILLSLIGIGLMAYYDYCDTTCSYLRGDILGFDLKWIGMGYMIAIIAFAAFKQSSFVRTLLAGGLGVEVHLYAFQVQNDVYCPFCLAFSVMLLLSFIINYEVPSAWREKRGRMWFYFLGEVDFSMFRIYRLPLLFFSLLGYLFVLLFFSGSVTPAYGDEIANRIPSLGNGKYEIVFFADYFCPPCKSIDNRAEPVLKELLAAGKVKITFADVPFHKETPVYAKYYLYAANANIGADNIFHVRKLLFEAAQIKNIEKENVLSAYLSEQKIALKPFNEKLVFPALTTLIKIHDVRATPSCIIQYSAKDVRKFVGEKDIWSGLMALKNYLSKAQ